MTKKARVFLIFLGVFVLVAGSLTIWALNSPIVDDYYWINKRGSEAELAFAFSIVLRTNHPAAYEMADPALKPRLDEWMKTHQAQRCTEINTTLTGSGTKEGFMVVFGCLSGNRSYGIRVDNILIENMKVMDWGDIREDR